MLEHGMHAPEAAAGEHGRAGRVIISRIEGNRDTGFSPTRGPGQADDQDDLLRRRDGLARTRLPTAPLFE